MTYMIVHNKAICRVPWTRILKSRGGKAAKEDPLPLGPTERPSRTEHYPQLARSNKWLVQALVPDKIHGSSEPWSRAQSMPRPSPGLECNQRLTRAPVSSAIHASPEPRSRAQSTPRPSPGLGARLPTHDDCTTDATWTMHFAHAAAGNDLYSNNSRVITKLGDLLIGEYNLQKGVKGDVVN